MNCNLELQMLNPPHESPDVDAIDLLDKRGISVFYWISTHLRMGCLKASLLKGSTSPWENTGLQTTLWSVRYMVRASCVVRT